MSVPLGLTSYKMHDSNTQSLSNNTHPTHIHPHQQHTPNTLNQTSNTPSTHTSRASTSINSATLLNTPPGRSLGRNTCQTHPPFHQQHTHNTPILTHANSPPNSTDMESVKSTDGIAGGPLQCFGCRSAVRGTGVPRPEHLRSVAMETQTLDKALTDILW